MTLRAAPLRQPSLEGVTTLPCSSNTIACSTTPSLMFRLVT